MTTKFEVVFAVVIAMGVVATSARCQTSTSRATERQRFALTIRSKQLEFKVGEEVAVEIAFTNTSDQPILAAPVIPTAEVAYKLDVRDENGDPVPETNSGRRLRTGKDDSGRETVMVFETAPLRYLQPGESIKERVVLSKLYDLSKAGKYTVQAQARLDAQGTAQSNKFTIEIKAVSPK